MADQTSCDICRNQAEYELAPPRVTLRCPRCGAFCYDLRRSAKDQVTRRNGTAVGLGARAERGWRDTSA
jgi:hypothetical protein